MAPTTVVCVSRIIHDVELGAGEVPAIQPDKDCSGWGGAGSNKCVDVLDEADSKGRFARCRDTCDGDQETSCAGKAGAGRLDKHMFVVRLILTR